MIPALTFALMILTQAAPPPPTAPAPPVPPEPPASIQVIEAGALRPSSFLGVVLADIDAAAVKRLGLAKEEGVLIRKVVEKSPAAEAGLKADDVLLAYGETAVISAAQLRRLVQETPVGRVMAVSVFREGRRMNLQVKIGASDIALRSKQRPDDIFSDSDLRPMRIIVERELDGVGEAEIDREERERARILVETELLGTEEELHRVEEELKRALEGSDLSGKEIEIFLKDAREGREHLKHLPPDPDHPFLWVERGGEDEDFHFQFSGMGKPRLGVGLQELGPQLAEYFGLKGRGGVLISSVSEGSAAAKAGMKAGDVILSVAGESVMDPGDVQRLVAKADAGALEVKVLRDKKEKSFKPVLEEREEKVIIKEKRVKGCPLDGSKQKKVIVKVGEPGSSDL